MTHGDVRTSAVVVSSMSVGNYEAFSDGIKFLQWSDIEAGKVAITNRFYLTGQSLKSMQAELLHERIKDILIVGFSTEYIDINLVQDVPGCGKTHCIVENVPEKIKNELILGDKYKWN